MDSFASTLVAGATPFLPDAVYRFVGHDVVVRSNSREVLEYTRAIYDRFYVGEESGASRESGMRPDDPFVMTVADHTNRSGGLHIEDRFGSTVLRCRDLYTFETADDDPPEPSYSPLAYVQRILLHRIPLLAEDRLFIHGGALSFEKGVVILPGASESGKTALCLKLVTRGFQLLSDEVACVHPLRRTVEPFPRTVRLSDSTRRLLEIPKDILRWDNDSGTEPDRWLLNPDGVFDSSCRGSTELRTVLFLQGPGETARLDPVSPATALFALLKLSIRPPAEPASELFRAAPLLDGMPCYNLVAGDLADTADLVVATLDGAVGADGTAP